MRISSIRLGHANNSSSSHSLIFLDPPPADFDVPRFSYGWEQFTLSSAGAKTDYLATVMYMNLRSALDEETAKEVVRQWLGIELPPTDDYSGIYIDHQSALSLPWSHDGSGLDRQFLEEFKEYLLQENLAILGGHDNDGEHPLSPLGAFRPPLPIQSSVGPQWVCRKDQGWWTLFNRMSGAKLRVCFDADVPEHERALTPELVDVKITDHCSAGCSFCYQDSTPNKRHVPLGRLEAIAQALGEMQVFEAALGGGEPTQHPQFIEVLRAFRSHGVTPNFTTRSSAWLRNDERRTQILAHAGSFAFSVSTEKEAKRALQLCQQHVLDGSRVSLQLVMGTMEQSELVKIMEAAGSTSLWPQPRVTLLGYKQVGRGHQFQPADYSDWLPAVAQAQKKARVPLAIDTKLAQDWLPALRRLGVRQELYRTTEGDYSCYIDAVEGKLGPSSYCEEGAYRLLHELDDPEQLAAELTREFPRLQVQGLEL